MVLNQCVVATASLAAGAMAVRRMSCGEQQRPNRGGAAGTTSAGRVGGAAGSAPGQSSSGSPPDMSWSKKHSDTIKVQQMWQ